jgi:predicted nuclease of predicted toxin-antitoxin system
VRWLADECLAAPLIELLRPSGHDVVYVAESAAGLLDTDVIEFAMREERLVLTEDKDFGDLVFRRKLAVPGIVLMRLGSQKRRISDGAPECHNRELRRAIVWLLCGR